MVEKNEENERDVKEGLEQVEIPVQKQAFDVTLPDGSVVNTESMDDEQYIVAVTMQRIQVQIEQLAPQVSEFEMKRRHFELEQKQLIDLLGSNGKAN